MWHASLLANLSVLSLPWILQKTRNAKKLYNINHRYICSKNLTGAAITSNVHMLFLWFNLLMWFAYIFRVVFFRFRFESTNVPDETFQDQEIWYVIFLSQPSRKNDTDVDFEVVQISSTFLTPRIATCLKITSIHEPAKWNLMAIFTVKDFAIYVE